VFVCCVKTPEEIIDIIERYRVNSCVIDIMPETRMAENFRNHFVESGECSVWMCRFHGHEKVGSQKYGIVPNYTTGEVQVNRTGVFDQSIDDIRYGRRQYPGDAFSIPGWTSQMKAPVRVFNETKGTISWTKGVDHYRLSDVYDRVAYDMMQMGGSFF